MLLYRQPFVVQTPEGTIAWALYVDAAFLSLFTHLDCHHSNSEIYNHQYLRDNYLSGMDIRSKSDSVVPGMLYQKLGDTNEIWNLLDGIFACIIYDGRYACSAATYALIYKVLIDNDTMTYHRPQHWRHHRCKGPHRHLQPVLGQGPGRQRVVCQRDEGPPGPL